MTNYEQIINEAAEKLEARFAEIQTEIAPLREEEREVADAIRRIVGSYPSGYNSGTPQRPVGTSSGTKTRAPQASAEERAEAVTKALAGSEGMNGTQLAELLGVTPSTVRKTLEPMVEAGTIKRTGEKRGTLYHAI
jgi:DNA-binding transcriptional ArsR family regulator